MLYSKTEQILGFNAKNHMNVICLNYSNLKLQYCKSKLYILNKADADALRNWPKGENKFKKVSNLNNTTLCKIHCCFIMEPHMIVFFF